MNHDFKKLNIWTEARALNIDVYKASTSFPSSELYGLTNQLRRSSVSISSNIAEGSGYGSDAQFTRYLNMALGSACEVESQLYLAKDLQYLTDADFLAIENKVGSIKKQIRGLLKKLKNNN